MVDSTFFPSSEYAHCPYCGQHEGMGLVTEKERVFVQCICGARGAYILRKDFEAEGRIDVKAMDSAARNAWNCRAGSTGVFELEVKIQEAVQRMLLATAAGVSSDDFIAEIRMWSEYLNNAQA